MPNDVAERIVLAVRRNEYHVIMPSILNLVFYLKPVLGFKMVYKIGNILKMHESMDTFVGRKR